MINRKSFAIMLFCLLLAPEGSDAWHTNQSADVVIGQVNMTSNGANQGGSPGDNKLYNPQGVFYNGRFLFVSDINNHRILIYRHIPTSNNAAADVVVGQANMTNNSSNQGGSPGANTLNNACGIFSDGQRLFVADTNNSRVLIYNQIPESNNSSADFVIGQANMTSNSANQGGAPGANTIDSPHDIFGDSQRLFVADYYNHRVLIYNQIPGSNNAPADLVIGQANLFSNNANQGGAPGANTLNCPGRVIEDRQRLIITGTGRHIIYP